METFRIYTCGGMSGLDWNSQNAWRSTVKEYLERVECPYRVVVLNPCDYYNFETITHRTEKEVMNFDLNLVRKSDLLLVNFNNPNSIGSAIELFAAYDKHIPVVAICEGNELEIHPWLLEYVDRMFYTMKDALKYIKSFYLVE
ncbi:MAG: Nucleoside 2-deoxyribosyltransferase [Anaerocolumna sp.]|jgi:nucleoside 2-deoxyribosyltransferase|nr:Nucleoside 2-deoxyribosyltransferase [Anaerocolumna sp.]